MNERDLRHFFEAMGTGDHDALAARLHESVILEFPGRRFGGQVEGKRRVLVFLRQNQRLFRDGLHFTVKWAAVMGKRGIAQWTNAGVTRSGREYANRGVTVFTFDPDGRCTRIEDYLDTERIAETWPTGD